MYRLLALGALGLAFAVAVTACGGSGNGSTTSVSVSVRVSTAPTATTTAPAVAPACRRLNAATRGALSQIGASLSRFVGVSSTPQLSKRTSALQTQISQSATRIDGVDTPPGPLTRDKQAISQALSDIASRLGTAHTAAEQGKVGAAARQLAGLARLTSLRHAATSLARDCPQA